MNRNTSRSPAGALPVFPIPMSRPAIEDAIEHLIALLDHLDPDPDLEDAGDFEPSVGADDREDDPADLEWSVGGLF